MYEKPYSEENVSNNLQSTKSAEIAKN